MYLDRDNALSKTKAKNGDAIIHFSIFHILLKPLHACNSLKDEQ